MIGVRYSISAAASASSRTAMRTSLSSTVLPASSTCTTSYSTSVVAAAVASNIGSTQHRQKKQWKQQQHRPHMLVSKSFLHASVPMGKENKKEETTPFTTATDIMQGHAYKTPDLALASSMPISCSEMDNNTLVTLGQLGNHMVRCRT